MHACMPWPHLLFLSASSFFFSSRGIENRLLVWRNVSVISSSDTPWLLTGRMRGGTIQLVQARDDHGTSICVTHCRRIRARCKPA